MSTRPYATRLGWAAVFAVHAALVVAASRNHAYIPDEDAYVCLARSLAEDGRYSLDFPAFWQAPGEPNTYYAPGWPGLLAVGQIAGGETGCWVVLWGVWCAAAVLSSLFGRAVGLPTWGRRGLVVWLTVYPFYGYYHGHLMTEPVAVCGVLAVLGLGLRFLRGPTPRAAAALAVASGLSHLTRTQLLLPVIAVWAVAFFAVRPRRLALPAAVFAAVHLAIVGPWLVRMWAVRGTPFGTETKLGSNLYTYCGATGGDGYRPDIAAVPYPPGLDLLTPAERDRVLFRAAIAGIAERPRDYLRTCGDRLGYLLSPSPNFVAASKLRTAAMAVSTAVFFYLPAAVAAAGLVRRRPHGIAVVLLVVTVSFWYAFHVALHASVRQRLPSDVVVAALALAVWTGSSARPGVARPRFNPTTACGPTGAGS